MLKRLTKGDKKPGTNPPQFENPLIEKATMNAKDAKVAKEIKKRLDKAVKRDTQAIQRIDKALKRIADIKNLSKLEKDKETAKKFVDKARDEKVRAKAVIESQAKKESKGV